MLEFIYCVALYMGLGCVAAVTRGTYLGDEAALDEHNRRYLVVVSVLWPLYLVVWLLSAVFTVLTVALAFVVGFARGALRRGPR